MHAKYKIEIASAQMFFHYFASHCRNQKDNCVHAAVILNIKLMENIFIPAPLLNLSCVS